MLPMVLCMRISNDFPRLLLILRSLLLLLLINMLTVWIATEPRSLELVLLLVICCCFIYYFIRTNLSLQHWVGFSYLPFNKQKAKHGKIKRILPSSSLGPRRYRTYAQTAGAPMEQPQLLQQYTSRGHVARCSPTN